MDSTMAVDIVHVNGSGSGSEESGGSSKNAKEVPIPKSKKTKSAAMKRKRKSRAVVTRERSQVWQHFTKEDHPIIETIDGKETVVGNTKRAQCKYCPTHLACHSTNNGTSSLRKHIEQVCTGYPGRTDLSKGQTHLNFDGSDDVVLKWSQDNCVIAATEMIVIDELPFSAIERPGFRRFCKVAVPNFTIPCRKTIVKTFLGMYDVKKAELKKELNNHCVCLTTDTWTSVQNINYMVITAHFIDNGWRMHKRVLNFCLIPNHQGNTIGKILECSLLQWGIKRVLTINVDNASANKVAIDYIRKKLCNLDQQQVMGGQFLHVRCLAHIVNLIVKSGLHILDKSIASIRNAVRYVRSSPSRLDAFKVCVENENLDSNKVCVLDVPTRWNSTYIMLDTALQLKRGFDRMAEEEDSKWRCYFDENEEEYEEDEEIFVEARQRNSTKRIGPPNEADWDKAGVFVRFLKVFFDVTVRVSATNHPTAPKAFHHMVTIESEIEDLCMQPYSSDGSESEKVLFQMAMKMRSKYKKYFGSLDDCNQLLLVALILDPRYKLLNFQRVCQKMLLFDDETVKKKSGEVKDLVTRLTDLYASTFGTQSSQKGSRVVEQVTGSSNSSSYRSKNVSGKMAELLEDWDRELEECDAIVVGHEVDRYLLDPIEKPPKGTNFEILTWWKLNGSKYPNLQLVAKDVLAIQVSTVASESCFSTGKRVIDPHRSSLTPRSVEALICLQNWLKSDSIQGLEYTPTPEEMVWLESVEKEQEKEERQKREKRDAEKAAKAAKAPKPPKAPKAPRLHKNSDAAKAAKK